MTFEAYYQHLLRQGSNTPEAQEFFLKIMFEGQYVNELHSKYDGIIHQDHNLFYYLLLGMYENTRVDEENLESYYMIKRYYTVEKLAHSPWAKLFLYFLNEKFKNILTSERQFDENSQAELLAFAKMHLGEDVVFIWKAMDSSLPASEALVKFKQSVESVLLGNSSGMGLYEKIYTKQLTAEEFKYCNSLLTTYSNPDAPAFVVFCALFYETYRIGSGLHTEYWNKALKGNMPVAKIHQGKFSEVVSPSEELTAYYYNFQRHTFLCKARRLRETANLQDKQLQAQVIGSYTVAITRGSPEALRELSTYYTSFLDFALYLIKWKVQLHPNNSDFQKELQKIYLSIYKVHHDDPFFPSILLALIQYDAQWVVNEDALQNIGTPEAKSLIQSACFLNQWLQEPERELNEEEFDLIYKLLVFMVQTSVSDEQKKVTRQSFSNLLERKDFYNRLMQKIYLEEVRPSIFNALVRLLFPGQSFKLPAGCDEQVSFCSVFEQFGCLVELPEPFKFLTKAKLNPCMATFNALLENLSSLSSTEKQRFYVPLLRLCTKLLKQENLEEQFKASIPPLFKTVEEFYQFVSALLGKVPMDSSDKLFLADEVTKALYEKQQREAYFNLLFQDRPIAAYIFTESAFISIIRTNLSRVLLENQRQPVENLIRAVERGQYSLEELVKIGAIKEILLESFEGTAKEDLHITILGPAPHLKPYVINFTEVGAPLLYEAQAAEEIVSQSDLIFMRAARLRYLTVDAARLEVRLLKLFAESGDSYEWNLYLKMTPQQRLWKDYQALSVSTKPKETLLALLKNNPNLGEASFSDFNTQIIFLKLEKIITANQKNLSKSESQIWRDRFSDLIVDLSSENSNLLREKINSLQEVKKSSLSLFSNVDGKIKQQWNDSLNEIKTLPIETLQRVLANYIELIKTSTDKSLVEEQVFSKLVDKKIFLASNSEPYCPTVTIFTVYERSNQDGCPGSISFNPH